MKKIASLLVFVFALNVPAAAGGEWWESEDLGPEIAMVGVTVAAIFLAGYWFANQVRGPGLRGHGLHVGAAAEVAPAGAGAGAGAGDGGVVHGGAGGAFHADADVPEGAAGEDSERESPKFLDLWEDLGSTADINSRILKTFEWFLLFPGVPGREPGARHNALAQQFLWAVTGDDPVVAVAGFRNAEEGSPERQIYDYFNRQLSAHFFHENFALGTHPPRAPGVDSATRDDIDLHLAYFDRIAAMFGWDSDDGHFYRGHGGYPYGAATTRAWIDGLVGCTLPRR